MLLDDTPGSSGGLLVMMTFHATLAAFKIHLGFCPRPGRGLSLKAHWRPTRGIGFPLHLLELRDMLVPIPQGFALCSTVLVGNSSGQVVHTKQQDERGVFYLVSIDAATPIHGHKETDGGGYADILTRVPHCEILI